MTHLPKSPPQNLEAEENLIGSMLNATCQKNLGWTFDELRGIVKGEMFYTPQHRLIFNAVCEAFDAGEPVDYVGIIPRLNAKEHRADWGEVTARLSDVADIANAIFYAGKVRKVWQLREIIRAAGKASEQAYHPLAEPGEIVQSLTERLLADPLPSNGRCLAITLASSVEPETVTWTWPSRIPCGKLSVICGDPEVGKSFLAVDIASKISMGTPWPDRRGEPNPVGDVIMLCAEDGLRDTIIPRLIEAGADLDRIRIIEGIRRTKKDDADVRMFNLDSDLRLLDDEIGRHPDTRLILIDPIGSYMGSEKNSYKDCEVREVLSPVAALAERRKIAVVALAHLNKQFNNSKAVYRMMGSVAFIAVPRAAWLVTRDPNSPTERLLLEIKNNLAPDPGGLRFTIEGQPTGRVHWQDGAVDTSADDALREPSAERTRPRKEAMEWLARELASGPVPASTIWKRADEKGYPPMTLKRAKEQLGVYSTRILPAEGTRKVSHWVLPKDDGDSTKPPP